MSTAVLIISGLLCSNSEVPSHLTPTYSGIGPWTEQTTWQNVLHLHHRRCRSPCQTDHFSGHQWLMRCASSLSCAESYLCKHTAMQACTPSAFKPTLIISCICCRVCPSMPMGLLAAGVAPVLLLDADCRDCAMRIMFCSWSGFISAITFAACCAMLGVILVPGGAPCAAACAAQQLV